MEVLCDFGHSLALTSLCMSELSGAEAVMIGC